MDLNNVMNSLCMLTNVTYVTQGRKINMGKHKGLSKI